MGAVRVAATFTGASGAPARDAELLVGATFTDLPPDVWEALAVEPEYTRRLRTADGRVLERQQGTVRVEIDGHQGTVPVLRASDGYVAVLGVTTLEILGLAVDPLKGELTESEYLYL